ncbi:EAP30/Vps36 family protein [Babesia bovis T2Bo]|nr:EAP30/Vps36 family protein [Babesia bovis T2Bo]EDO07166.2 EAP30/Vps36 family protein [Babesia bovis T2Bo]
MECELERNVTLLRGFCIRKGLMGKVKNCGDATLTSNRLCYDDGDSEQIIPVSRIQDCQLKKLGTQTYIKIKSVDAIYYITYDGDIADLHQELTNLLKIHETRNVIGRSASVGGVSRVVQMKYERVADANELRMNVMADLNGLKKKSKKVLNMARHIFAEKQTLSKTFGALNLNIFETEGQTVKSMETTEILVRLLKEHKFILLQDLFCMVNRMRLCDLLTAKELRANVELLQEEKICKLVDIQGVCTIVANDVMDLLEDIAKIVEVDPITPLQLAEIQSISISLAEYKLRYAELEGVVTRDDATYYTQYYRNPFLK